MVDLKGDNMSLISEQVQRLRNEANKRKCESVGKILMEAAVTIEELSEKLTAANMQRSERYYGAGIPEEEKREQGEEL